MPFHERRNNIRSIIAQDQREDAALLLSNLNSNNINRTFKMATKTYSKSSSSTSTKPSKWGHSLSCKLTSSLITFTITMTYLSIIIFSLAILQITPTTNAHSLSEVTKDRRTRHQLTDVTELNNNIQNNNNNNINANNNNLDNNIAPQTNGNSNHRAGQSNGFSLNGGHSNRCNSGWMWFNNKCWVATQSRRDFSHAVELCKKLYNSSTLPTIHTEEENEFLRQKLDLKNSPIWLHARHNHQYNKTRWLDRTGVNYTHWDAGQPSDKASLVCIRTEDMWYMKKTELKDGQTECVSFWEDGKWGTQVGCQVLLPVVCEKKLTPMAKYQIQPNGSDPSLELINSGLLSGTNGASRAHFGHAISLFSIVASTFVGLVSYH